MRIDIWSDVVCPFCYIGRARLEGVIDRFAHAEELRGELELVWHSFELDPSTPAGENRPMVESVAVKYGMPVEVARQQNEGLAAAAAGEGLQFNFERALNANTFDAHRLVHLAGQADRGLADTLEQRFMRAYFTEGRAVDDHAVLTELAVEVGLEAEAVARVLGSSEFADAVRADESAAQQLGISGVPFFVFDEKWAVSGAQPAEVFEQALTTAWEASQSSPFQMVVGADAAADAPVCGPDGCAVPPEK